MLNKYNYSIENIYYIIFILFGIFIIALALYYIVITMRFKHTAMVEKFVVNNEHPDNPNFRQCQVYFLNDGEINDVTTCDEEYKKNPETTTCKYEYDGWQERADQVDENNNTATYKKKIFKNGVFDKTGFVNFTEDTRCFKELTTNISQDSNDKIHRFGNKNYLFQEFTTGSNVKSGVCDIIFPIQRTIKDMTFYKFILDTSNKITDVKRVNIKSNEMGFEVDPEFNISTFTSGQSYGIEYLRYDNTTKMHIFNIFQISTFPPKRVDVHTFKYNYICDPSTQVIHKNQYSAQINIGSFIKFPTASNGVEYSFPINLPNGGDTFNWDYFMNTDANNKKDKRQLIIDKLKERKEQIKANIAASLTARSNALEKERDDIKTQEGCDITCLSQFKDNNRKISDILTKIYTTNKISTYKNELKYIKQEADMSDRVYDDIVIRVKNTFAPGLTKYVINIDNDYIENMNTFDDIVMSDKYIFKEGVVVDDFTNLNLNNNRTTYFTGYFYVPITANYKFTIKPNDTSNITSPSLYINNKRELKIPLDEGEGETNEIKYMKEDIVKIDICFASHSRDSVYTFGWKIASNTTYTYSSSGGRDVVVYFHKTDTINNNNIRINTDGYVVGRFLMTPKNVPDDDTGDYYYEFKDTYLQYGIEIKKNTKCDILIVGGGGGGGGGIGGGGGAGSVVHLESVILPIGEYTVTVGDGGLGKYRMYPSGKGENSSISSSLFSSIIAEGGGGTTGGHDHGDGLEGGSGGGAAGPQGTLNKGGAVGKSSSLGGFKGTIYGNRGGNNTTIRTSDTTNATGGGGAGSASLDTNPSSGVPGNGGSGIGINITGTNVYYGGGGGGGGHKNAGNGGLGGGGNGSSNGNGSPGIANTGGGGGGGAWESPIGGNGGSGIVIIRVKMTGETIVSSIDFSKQNIS